jgi:spore germination cell wall hydrolase CwlJ-like protein
MEFKRPVADVDVAALDRQRQCLSIGIYYEARGETLKGQLAVAEVILNRVKSNLYPDNVCDVVYQGSKLTTGCQFSFTCDGMSEKPHDRRAWRQARSVAEQALLGRVRDNVVGKALFYHADYVRPRWANNMVEVTKVGRHIFYRLKGDAPMKKTELASSDG